LPVLGQILRVVEALESPSPVGELLSLFKGCSGLEVEAEELRGGKGETTLIRVHVKGQGSGPTLGVVGRLGGVSARPLKTGLVSDADGAGRLERFHNPKDLPQDGQGA
jgi:hypothetical protein